MSGTANADCGRDRFGIDVWMALLRGVAAGRRRLKIPGLFSGLDRLTGGQPNERIPNSGQSRLIGEQRKN